MNQLASFRKRPTKKELLETLEMHKRNEAFLRSQLSEYQKQFNEIKTLCVSEKIRIETLPEDGMEFIKQDMARKIGAGLLERGLIEYKTSRMFKYVGDDVTVIKASIRIGKENLKA